MTVATDGRENKGGLFSELIACDMAVEACKIGNIVTTLSMLLKDPNQRSLKGTDLLTSYEYQSQSFRGPMALSRHVERSYLADSRNSNSSMMSSSGGRGWVAIGRGACPAAAIVAIKSAVQLDGNMNGSTALTKDFEGR